MDNKTVEAALTQIARVLDLKGENTFKVRAYENAARAIASLQEDVVSIVKEARLRTIPGIGESIAEKITLLVTTGKLPYLEEISQGIPPGLFDLMKVQGLGPKKTKVLWEQLGVTSLESLEVACKTGQVAGLKGFGAKTQEKILSGLAMLARNKDRVLRTDASPLARVLAGALREVAGVSAVEVAGSLRRGRETVKDLDILVGATAAEPVMKAFLARPEVRDVIGHGPTKTSVHVHSGIQVDVRVVAPESFACALAYFTGSKEFNVALRQLALEKGFSLNEYHLRPLDGSKPPALATEVDLFAALGLDWVPPELRENTGEISHAIHRTLPRLVEPQDVQGVLHVHTKWSDGAATVGEMVAQAAACGYRYVGISDHSIAAHYANGLSPERLKRQRDEIEAARAAHPGIVVLHGVESDIMPDGTLDLPDDCLASLDFVIASVHTELGMERDAMTRRVTRAVSHPLVRVLGHPLGRRLLERESSQFDWEPVLDAAAANGVAIEVNGQPQRLDADWVHIRRVRAKGVKLCLNPDAHAPESLEDARTNALTEARRGWATKDDVVNSLPADRFVAEFLRKQGARPTTPARPAPIEVAPAPAPSTAAPVAVAEPPKKKRAAAKKKAAVEAEEDATIPPAKAKKTKKAD